MAFDSSRGVIVVFGGIAGGADANDTWEYDGVSWAAGPAAPGGLTPRDSVGMTYDSVRGVVVLFGGYGSTTYNDTWEYDGNSWVAGPAAPAGLTARYDLPLTYDPNRSVVLLFGGIGLGGELNDTWEYDGASWVQGPVAPAGLTVRAGSSLSYSSSSGSAVLFGGGTFSAKDDTWLYQCLTLLPSALPGGFVGVSYLEVLDASGGLPPYSFNQTSGTLPPGLSLAATGTLSGTPTMAGSYTFLAHAIDANGCAGSLAYTIDIACSPSVTIVLDPPTLSPAQVGASYNVSISASGGSPPYSFAVTNGALPPGLTLSATGTLSGTPMAVGTYPFDVTATDSVGCSGWRAYSLVVSCPPITINPAFLKPATTGASYQVALTATGGVPPYTFAMQSGSLPPGVTLTSAGLLSGTPTSAGLFSFSVSASDAASCSGSRSYTLRVLLPTDFIAGEGAGAPNPNRVRVYDSRGIATMVDFFAYGATGYGVKVSSGGIDTSPAEEILTGPGPGDLYGPQVKGFTNGGTAMGKVNFFAYGTLKFGANVASEDTDGDEMDEILSGAGSGDVFGPHVRGWDFDGVKISPIARINFFAYRTLKYGVNVSGGDLDGDRYVETLTAPGPGVIFAPQIRGWNHDGGTTTSMGKVNFIAFSLTEYGGTVAGGAVDSDLFDEILCAPGPGPTSSFPARFKGFNFDAANITALAGYETVAYSGSFYGGRVGAGDTDPPLLPDGLEELLTGAGPDPARDATVESFAYDGSGLTVLPVSFLPFPDFYGVDVTAGGLGQ